MNSININKVTIAGILTQDSDKRATNTGSILAFNSLVITKRKVYQKATGETEEYETKIYINITAFGKVADQLLPLKKGTNVIVFGELSISKANPEKGFSSKYFVNVQELLVVPSEEETQLSDNALF